MDQPLIQTIQTNQQEITEAPVVKPKIKIIKKKDDSAPKKASEIYQRMEHAEHIYKKPDTYTGSCEVEDCQRFLLCSNDDGVYIAEKTLKLTPAFYKCFDELLVNAHDHKKRMEKVMETKPENHHQVTTIKVTIHDDDSISFYNDGDGILVEYMEEHKMYPPELIFGSLLTSTNFDDNEQREWGGRNGYGAKLANIFSKRFTVDTVCHINKKRFTQTFCDNMNKREEPIVKQTIVKPFTCITWLPDYERFGMTGLNDELRQLIKRRTYDMAGVTDRHTKVYFNEKLVETRGFEKYVELYLKDKPQVVFDEGLGWHIAATSSEDDVFQQVSFVNGIATTYGGTHVDYIADQIKTKLAAHIKTKRKLDIKPQIIKNQLRLFVNATKIVNPAFDSQTKETLKTTKSKFGTQYDISDKFIAKLATTDIMDKIINQSQFKDSQLLSKTDGSKTKKVKVEKLDDAHFAGTKNAKNCTIIFTEGDSAKSLAIAGLAEIGRDYYGVFPLRGKVLNVREANTDQIMKCQVLNDIKKIIGLQNGKNYAAEYQKTGTWPLRYGKMMLMTDQDHDGSHIKGLMMNIFDSMWPSLLDLGFITTMVTPIVKAFKGKEEVSFYSLQDYDKWKETVNIKQWTIKYYKGLGTSTAKEGKEYFRALKVITYEKEQKQPVQQPIIAQLEKDEVQVNIIENPAPNVDAIEKASQLEKISNSSFKIDRTSRLDLAFNKKRADDRKQWLRNYNRNSYTDYNTDKISFSDFVDRELIHFSNADNDRSIPSIMDGLKPSQRKVLFSAFKRNLTNEIKVAQFSGYISEHSAYHHGEVSLQGTIVGMAQDFVGSNNLNLFMPNGQFGTRLHGGKDSASPRYIFTELNKLTRTLFKKEDDAMCNYLNDDGFPIEPEYYYPIIPTICINGATGIGTGFSTEIPQYNPIDIANYIKAKVEGNVPNKLMVWYRGFTGQILQTSPSSYLVRGKYNVINNDTVKITELPVGKWTQSYIEYLESMEKTTTKDSNSKQFIKHFVNNSTDTQVDITIYFADPVVDKWVKKVNKDGSNELEDKLKLITSISTNNMHVFDVDGKIIKFNSIEELIDYWLENRRYIYVKRRDYQLEQLQKELDIIAYKVKFILEIISNTLEIRNVKKALVIKALEDKNYMKIATKDDNPSYDYLLGMDLYKLTEEEIDELKKKKEMKEAQLAKLQATTVEDIWKLELEEFKDNYTKLLLEYAKEHGGVTKKIVKRTIIKKKPIVETK